MKTVLRGIAAVILVCVSAAPTYAAISPVAPADTHHRARVTEILEEGVRDTNGMSVPYQTVLVRFTGGALSGREVTVQHGSVFTIRKDQFVRPGQYVVVLQTTDEEGAPAFQIIDTYRLDTLLPFLAVFIVLVLLLSRWRGLGAIAGMAISLLVIAGFIVPQILAGGDPLLISITGGIIIMITTIYLAHGFSVQTTLALIATSITLILTGLMSVWLVNVLNLSGLGSEDAYSLKLSQFGNINFRGLLMGGILIGALGVLDDVTTGLAAAVFELHRTDPKLTLGKLMRSGMRIGQEHVSSLVNTLVLAYAGVSLPLFIILITNPNGYPLWSILNSEMMMEEIIRTLAGSFGLLFAVPLTTYLTAWYLTRAAHKSSA